MPSANKRFTMTLYSGSKDIESHRARIVLAEKGLITDIVEVDQHEERLKELKALNPYQTVPTLVDRDLVIYQSRIIMEYLDERFPHPPLLPPLPISRAKFRLMIFRIENWYHWIHKIETASSREAAIARKELQENLISIAPIFKEYPFFLSDDFTMVDCSLMPLLWRLPNLEISLATKSAQPILDYSHRVFERESFRSSLTEAEAELRLHDESESH